MRGGETIAPAVIGMIAKIFGTKCRSGKLHELLMPQIAGTLNTKMQHAILVVVDEEDNLSPEPLPRAARHLSTGLEGLCGSNRFETLRHCALEGIRSV